MSETKKDLDGGLNDYENYIVHSSSVKIYPNPSATLNIWRLSGKRNVSCLSQKCLSGSRGGRIIYALRCPSASKP